MTTEKLLEIKDLTVRYKTDGGVVHAVNNLFLNIQRGEAVGLVGETGAGKTTTARAILRLIPNPPGKIEGGEILLNGEDIVAKTEVEMRKIRGNKVSMIFQDPMTSLNPVMQVVDQIAEVVLLHEKISKKRALEKAVEMLEKVGIGAERAKEYPHQFSGGMRQRVGIAISLACNPELLIADEPTTALDVTIQAQVLELMWGLKKDSNTAMIMITHDLGIVADICDKVAIMYAGSVVEFAPKYELFRYPKHPYTVGLFGAIPDISNDDDVLKPIEGLMPDPTKLPTGCPFHPRCAKAKPECSQVEPGNVDIGDEHFVKCILLHEQGVE